MKINNKNYPYPILANGSDDYLNSSFDINILDGPKEENGVILIEMEAFIKCNSLLNLINDKMLSVVAQIFSKNTSFRKIYYFDELKLSLSIPKNFLGNKVIINTFLIANKDIDNFINEETNKDYFSMPVNIKKGDKIGFSDVLAFDLKPYDALRPIASIVLIKEDKRKDAEILDVDLSGEKINIYLNSDLYEKYKNLRLFPELRMHLSISIVMPAIIEALYELKNNPELDNDRKWVISIKRVLKQIDIDLFSTDLSCYGIANLIFKNGLNTCLDSLEKFYNIDNKE